MAQVTRLVVIMIQKSLQKRRKEEPQNTKKMNKTLFILNKVCTEVDSNNKRNNHRK
jgi:hypothetical protein